MEDLAHSQNSTLQNGSETNKEQVAAHHAAAAAGGNNTAPESAAGEASVAAGSGQVVKRGRGRPRKNQANGSHPPPATPPQPELAIQLYGGGDGVKRGRGRPRGSGKLQILASIGGLVTETAGGGFTPHVVNVSTGEDVVSKIISFFQKGPRAVCILSANGPVSSVTIRQPGATNTLKYEGHFEILSLIGSWTSSTGAGGAYTKNSQLTVSLAKPDGMVFGGNVESSLIAAGPIQLILATFKQNISNQIKKRRSNGSSNVPSMAGNPDSTKVDLQKVPKLTEGESSCPSPTSTLRLIAPSNGLVDDPITETTNAVPENVTIADKNMHFESVRGVDLEYHYAV